jgi:dTDP-4-amino-4,6-dideoxygalactose transaminase
VGAGALWRPLHAQPRYAEDARLGGDVSDALFHRGLSLPCSTDLTEADQDQVIQAVLGHLAGSSAS